MIIRVMLVGEGANELGHWARHQSYRDNREPGVLEAVLRCLRVDGWTIGHARLWKEKPRTYRSLTGTPKRVHPEQHKVLSLTLDAIESRCDALVFVRDGDGDSERAGAVRAGLEHARERAVAWTLAGMPVLRIAGATAIPTLEAWLLALAGRTKTESLSRSAAQDALETLGVKGKNTADMRAWVERYGVESIAADAASLRDWVLQLRIALECDAVD